MKTFSTSGTGSQQTLSEIESDKMPVYETEADLEADLANLEVGQIGATKGTGSELSAPVDTVQSGNMHAVTSNAVANALAEIDVTNKITPATGTTVLKAIKKGNQVFMTFDVATTTSNPSDEIATIDDEISPNYRVVGSACFPNNSMANNPVSTIIEHYNNVHHINVYTGAVSQVLVTFNYFI